MYVVEFGCEVVDKEFNVFDCVEDTVNVADPVETGNVVKEGILVIPTTKGSLMKCVDDISFVVNGDWDIVIDSIDEDGEIEDVNNTCCEVDKD